MTQLVDTPTSSAPQTHPAFRGGPVAPSTSKLTPLDSTEIRRRTHSIGSGQL